jgi:AraC-like DNA-binding protein
MANIITSYYKPRPPLSEFVEVFWYWDNPTPTPSIKERLLPMGTVEFVIRLGKNQSCVYDPLDMNRSQKYSGSILSGPHTNFFVLDKSDQDHLIGIHFKPGGAFPFFGVALNELRDHHISFEDLRANDAKDLRCELLDSDTAQEKFQILEKYLLRFTGCLEHHPAVRYALKQFQNVPFSSSISQLADDVNLSQRRFIEVFSQQVGLTPKMFCRIRRFQEVLKLVHQKREVDWLDIVSSCGYFDQAHFIHDFQAFSGINPTVYLNQRTEHFGHVPIDPR